MKRNVFMRASGLAVLLALSVQAFAADGDKNHTAKAVDSKSGRWATAYPEYSAFSKSLKGLSEKDGKFKLWKDESSQEWSYDKAKMGKAWNFMKDTAREYRIQLAAGCADSDKGAKWFGELMDYCLDTSLGAKLNNAEGSPVLEVATLSACDLEMKWYFDWKKKAGKLSAGDEQFAKGSENFFKWFSDDLMKPREEGASFNSDEFNRQASKDGVKWVSAKSKQIRELVKSSDYNKENICEIGDLAKSGTGDTSGTDCKGGIDCGSKATGGYEQKPATSYGNTPGGLPAAQAYPSAGYSNGAGFYDPGVQNYNKKDGYGNIAGLMSGLYNGNQNYQQQPYIPPAAPPGAAAPGIAAAPAPIFPAQGVIGGYGGGGVGVGVAVRKYPRPYPPQPYPMPLPQPLPPGPVPVPLPEPVKKAKVKVTVKETTAAKPISNPTPVQLPVQAKPFQIPGRPGWWIMGQNGQPVPYNPQVQFPVTVYPNPIRPVTPVTPGYPTNPVNPIFPTVPPVTPVYPTVLPTPGPTVGPVTPDPIRNRIPRTTSRAK